MSLLFAIKVVPSSGRQAFELDKNGNLKCYLKNAPENNKANLELIKILAKNLGLIQNEIEIIAGATNRNKKIKIVTNLSYRDLLHALALRTDQVEQKAIF